MDSIILQTGDNTVTDGDVIGRLGFAASSETGTNARLVVAKIEAVAEEAFDASNNSTEMVFYLAADGAAASKMTLTSAGNLNIAGELQAASLDIEGNADINGTTNLDAVDIDGAVDLAGELKLTGAFVPGAGINAQTDDTSIGLDLSEGNYFEVTLTNGQTPVATIDITNASLGQRFMVRVIQPSNGNIVLDSVADGWDAVQVNSGSRVATKWGGGVGPTLTTGNGSADLYGFVIRGLAGSAAIDGFIIGQDIKAT